MPYSLTTLSDKHRSELIGTVAKRCAPNKDTGCLEWPGATNGEGYGQIKRGGRTFYAHRIAHEAAKGPLPDGMEIDHLCRNPKCANPAHLEAVTRRENIMRGLGPSLLAARNAARTHCAQGHGFSPENTRMKTNKKGHVYRQCRECRRRIVKQQKVRAKLRKQGLYP